MKSNITCNSPLLLLYLILRANLPRGQEPSELLSCKTVLGREENLGTTPRPEDLNGSERAEFGEEHAEDVYEVERREEEYMLLPVRLARLP